MYTAKHGQIRIHRSTAVKTLRFIDGKAVWCESEPEPAGAKGLNLVKGDVAHASTRLDPWMPGAPRYSKLGAPIFYNRREIDNFAALHQIEYDP